MFVLVWCILSCFRNEEEKREAARQLEEWREEKRKTEEREEEQRLAEEIQKRRWAKVLLAPVHGIELLCRNLLVCVIYLARKKNKHAKQKGV